MSSISGAAPVQPVELPPEPPHFPQPLDQAPRQAPIAGGVSRMLEAASADGASLSRTGIAGERELVSSEDSVTAGWSRDAYDLRLYREPEGGYTLEMNMKIDFKFIDPEEDTVHTTPTGIESDFGRTFGSSADPWTPQGKQEFMSGFSQAIDDTWNGHTIATHNGQEVKLAINLDIEEDVGDRGENWNIDVVKILEGTLGPSWVDPTSNGGSFDNEDVKPFVRSTGEVQVAAAHEFGHMLGLPDEYNGNAGPEAREDNASVLHLGMEVRDRHFVHLSGWVENNA